MSFLLPLEHLYFFFPEVLVAVSTKSIILLLNMYSVVSDTL